MSIRFPLVAVAMCSALGLVANASDLPSIVKCFDGVLGNTKVVDDNVATVGWS